MRSLIQVAVVAVLITLGTALTPNVMQGQDCGEYCLPCGFFGYEGSSYQPDGAWDMGCRNFSSTCAPCGGGAGGGAEAQLTADISAAADSSPEILDELIGRHSARLLVLPERGIVAIRGLDCNVDGISAIVFAHPRVTARLVAFGVERLDEYLSHRYKAPAQ